MRVIRFKNKESQPVRKNGGWRFIKMAVPRLFLVLIIFGAGWVFGGGHLELQRYRAVPGNKNLPAHLDYSSVDTIYQSIKSKYDGKLNETDLLNGMKTGLAGATGDPYTEYFSPKDATDFYGQLNGTFEGIGAELGKNDSGDILIISPLAGYPAEKAGLKSKDIIAEIDGKTTSGFTIDQAVKQIRGKAGSTVKMTIIRDSKAQEISITREKITIPSVKSEVRDGIGILTVSRFGSDTTDLATKAAQDFKSQNVSGVVLDLRGDPGGLVDAAVGVSSLWLPRGKTIFTARRDKTIIVSTTTSTATSDPVLGGIPTIVLIDGGSASASEITASALKDNKVATLMGLKSFGKGSEQEPMDLNGGGLLKVTIAHWYTPAGKNIDKQGITPDKEVKITEDDIKNKVDPQLNEALAQLKG